MLIYKSKNLKENVADILLDVAIIVQPHKPFKYRSGIISPIYTDCRLLLSKQKQLGEIVKIMIKKIQDEKLEFDAFVSMGVGGVYAELVAYMLNKPLVIVRDTRKDHGKEKEIEGMDDKDIRGKTFLVLEDHITTGSGVMHVIDKIRDYGGKINNCIAILTYGLPISISNFKDIKVDLITLTDLSTVIEVAEKTRKGIKNQEEKLTVLKWKENPNNWGKEMGFV